MDPVFLSSLLSSHGMLRRSLYAQQWREGEMWCEGRVCILRGSTKEGSSGRQMETGDNREAGGCSGVFKLKYDGPGPSVRTG